MERPEIDPAKLFTNAPLVLGKLATLTQLILSNWADAPEAIRAHVGDSVALINKLAKTEVQPDECVVQIEAPRKRKRATT